MAEYMADIVKDKIAEIGNLPIRSDERAVAGLVHQIDCYLRDRGVGKLDFEHQHGSLTDFILEMLPDQ